ncbi:uncharacterized protein LOC126742836 [Anthonomus grandis grandis]|uniref:uncharacterized protein LOC126742836 n=1 Tax=Anthonomus grandis grandis TaxID=2921223 RepID=UPI0021652B9D|nr:uncharacterized protein LOC126742836 [Anthonomus grandis grandis]
MNVDESFGILEFGQGENTKTLELTWSCKSDYLTYRIKIQERSSRSTKRDVLSEIALIFDPLGLLAPCVVVVVKVLLQKLWLQKVSWDDSLPAKIHSTWTKFREELPYINDLKIPRHVTCVKPEKIELHGFSDACDYSYGACIYLRSIDAQGIITVRLLYAKSKVSPLKPLTTPRLELCAALVLARLAEKVLRSLTCNIERWIFWTDSSIVLGWLKTAPNLLKTFVSSRVSEI